MVLVFVLGGCSLLAFVSAVVDGVGGGGGGRGGANDVSALRDDATTVLLGSEVINAIEVTNMMDVTSGGGLASS
jgi:hypothetical protein